MRFRMQQASKESYGYCYRSLQRTIAMYYKGQSSARLQDSTQRGSGTELLIVEG